MYLSGIGYAGIYAPHLAQNFLTENENKLAETPFVNIAGVILGNAAVTKT